MARPLLERPWYQSVAELMVKEDMTFAQAATRHNVSITTVEADKHYQSAAFQRILRAERRKYDKELVSGPDWSKETLAGQMVALIEKLRGAGEFEKALSGLYQLARVEGWVGEGANVNVFAGLSHKELEEIKHQLMEKKTLEQSTTSPGPSGKTSVN